MPTIEYRFNLPLAVFEVSLPEHKPVYMSLELNECAAENNAVVIVDSERFLALWRSEPHSIHSEQAFGNPETWRNDRKFHHAEKWFSFGHSNPVPLADVSFDIEEKTVVSHRFLWFGRTEIRSALPYIGFSNGITRTIWLLSHRCKSFPLKCNLAGAEGLLQHSGTTLYTVRSLLDQTTEA